MPSRRFFPLFSFVLALGCAKPPAPRADQPSPPVSVAVAQTKTVPVTIRAIGSVKVISTVSVRPQVSGEITAVHFAEGTDVKKGQKLFTIDPRTYEAAVKLAEANMAKNEAVKRGAELDLRRITRTGMTAISPAELDAAKTAVESAKAAVAADEAALSSARLLASYTVITSPINGRAGAMLVTPGNLVTASEITPLVVINQLSPITVAFAVPEQHLPALSAARATGPLKVEADLRGGGPLASGTLEFIDNTVDPTTGTLQCKAFFANDDRKLWPGLFVDVTLTLGERPDSVVVPASAVQAGQQGSYVYIVGPDGKAEARIVTVAFEAGTETVIATGLKGGETVITDGQLRVAPGVKVDVKNPTKNPAKNPEGAAK